MAVATIATCNLDQWALDFEGNLRRIQSSIRIAKAAKATYRLGPELEIPGYGCEDHFLEMDTFLHSWEALKALLEGDLTDDIVCDIGMPVLHRGVRYNCRVLCLNRRILLIRPKMFLADDGNYRESRWFAPWAVDPAAPRPLEEHDLPANIRAVTGQGTAPFGVAVLQALDASVAPETCEELFTPQSPNIWMGLDGVDIVTNGSGSHHQLRKLNTRVDLMRGATAKGGGAYVYANQQGCDGGRLYYDGCALVIVNGECVAQGSQFSVADVEVVTAAIDLEDIRSYRGAMASRGQQAAAVLPAPRVRIDFSLTAAPGGLRPAPSAPRPVQYLSPEEEISLGPACWLWDYLRRSGGAGFFLPLSGGADSASTCAMVGIMCRLVHDAVGRGDAQVLADVRRVTGQGPTWVPASAAEIAGLVMHTCYMGTAHSSAETRDRARAVAADVGAYHVAATIDDMVAAVVAVFLAIAEVGAGRRPRFAVQGGTRAEDLALQNVQARLRMVLAYFLAQLLPWVRGRSGFLLVLGSANVDEALRGYMTKYDCSSADVNPIGSIAKGDLKRFLLYAAEAYGFPSLAAVAHATPTAELVPASQDAATGAAVAQTDEADMGMSYEELGWFGRLRKVQRCGPLSMYHKLVVAWPHLAPAEVAEKVKRFFFFYSINRHKLTTLTPSYHAESYSPDDNRFDLRPFLYNPRWDWQFAAIDRDVQLRGAAAAASAAGVAVVAK